MRMPLRVLLFGFVAGCVPAQDNEVQAPAPQTTSDFARFVAVGADEGRFETAVTTYRDADDRRVSLVAAVHIADAAHYAELQRVFETFDVVLYELIADPDDRPTPGQERYSSNPIALLQTLLKNGLELEFQLTAIDYTKPNFVHADLTPAAFAERMRERGLNVVTLLLRELSLQSKRMRELQESEERAREEREARGEPEPAKPKFDLAAAFRRGEGRHTMRMMFAQQLEQLEEMLSGTDDPASKSLILDDRNDRAVEVLQQQLAEGADNLGIYYGAAHMPGIERALTALGFVKESERWLVAWDIHKRPDRKPGKRPG